MAKSRFKGSHSMITEKMHAAEKIAWLREALKRSRDVHAELAEFILNAKDRHLKDHEVSGLFADLQRARLSADAALTIEKCNTQVEPAAVAWTWKDRTGCDHIDMDEDHAMKLAAICETEPTPLYAVPTPLYVVPPAPTPAVRHLEWDEITSDRGDGNTEGTGCFEAETPFNIYTIGIVAETDTCSFEVFDNHENHFGRYYDIDKAKAAAQADFGARILSALSTTPDWFLGALEELASAVEVEPV